MTRIRTCVLLLAAFAPLAGCIPHHEPALPPAIGYAGGDGSSCAQAVIIVGAATEAEGVQAEIDWIRTHYPGGRRGAQTPRTLNGRNYDSVEILTAEGRVVEICFDVTGSYGKHGPAR